MLRIAGPDEVAHHPPADLSRVLHPSAGLPGPVALALAVTGEPPAPPEPPEPTEARPPVGAPASVPGKGLAEVRRLADHPRFGAGHRRRRHPSR